jgi:hypothetical protein
MENTANSSTQNVPNEVIKFMLQCIHPVSVQQDIYCPRIKWIEDNGKGKGEWKCLKQKRGGFVAILNNPHEKEKIERENIDYFIYFPCNCNNHKNCIYNLGFE